MSAPDTRRDFLRGLTALPLIGGAVTLIGQPTAAAVPVTPHLLATYESWLGWERLRVCRQLYGDERFAKHLEFYPVNDLAWRWHHDGVNSVMDRTLRDREACARAPVVLSAAGVPIGGGA